MEFKFENVNDAFRGLVEGIAREPGDPSTIETVTRESRVGNVLMIPEPVTVLYRKPLECVLFNQARDCNPFFHLFESLWMLAGRNDVAPLKFYNSKIGEVASDDGETFNGAYGYRWRNSTNWIGADGMDTYDQLDILIEHLKDDPNSRRAVLQMWSVEDDLLKVDETRDVCCNTAVYFSIKENRLDMTVTNRSNDLIWGMLGANVVHFSFLQEYMAICIGVEVGNYYQFTNNLHVYESNWHPEKWLVEYVNRNAFSSPIRYTDKMRHHVPLLNIVEKSRFDEEVVKFVEHDFTDTAGEFCSAFLANVAAPMCRAFAMHRLRDYEAAEVYCGGIGQIDWLVACEAWISRRKNKYLKGRGAK